MPPTPGGMVFYGLHNLIPVPESLLKRTRSRTKKENRGEKNSLGEC